jgi:formylglycine-generating enzyme required for sulfatase activity
MNHNFGFLTCLSKPLSVYVGLIETEMVSIKAENGFVVVFLVLMKYAGADNTPRVHNPKPRGAASFFLSFRTTARKAEPFLEILHYEPHNPRHFGFAFTMKLLRLTKLHSLFIGLALSAGIHPALTQTTPLSIALEGNQVVISWPAAATNCFLQSATNLSPTAWSTVSAAPVVISGQYTVTNPMSGTQQFYQLSQTPIPGGMALIPAGPFTMGDTLDGEWDAIPTNVYVSAFYMDVNLVSYSQWQTVYSYATSHGYGFDHAGSAKDNAANQPVQTVNWYDVVKWSNARSQQAGLTPVYYTDAGLTQAYTNGEVDAVYANWTVSGYRLATEAEWEKAARGGLSGKRFPWGNTISWSHANYYGDPLTLDPNGLAYDLSTAIDFDPAFSGGDNGDYPYTSPVGSFAANGYGLYDMAGNVYEFCWDWYAPPPYPAGSPYLGGTDPRGPASSPYASRCDAHCGGYGNSASHTRCAGRHYNLPSYNTGDFGFRCVRGH